MVSIKNTALVFVKKDVVINVGKIPIKREAYDTSQPKQSDASEVIVPVAFILARCLGRPSGLIPVVTSQLADSLGGNLGSRAV